MNNEQEKRQTALKWWNNLLYIDKFEYSYVYFKVIGMIDRDLSGLTGREIELIYNMVKTKQNGTRQ